MVLSPKTAESCSSDLCTLHKTQQLKSNCFISFILLPYRAIAFSITATCEYNGLQFLHTNPLIPNIHSIQYYLSKKETDHSIVKLPDYAGQSCCAPDLCNNRGAVLCRKHVRLAACGCFHDVVGRVFFPFVTRIVTPPVPKYGQLGASCNEKKRLH